MVWPTANIPTYGRGVWLECNGQSFSTTQFPQLYETLGTNRVPDYQGVFLRGYGTSEPYRIENIVGNGGNVQSSSGEIGEIQPMQALRFGEATPALFVNWAADNGWQEVTSNVYNPDRRWYTYSSAEDHKQFFGSLFGEAYENLYPWTIGIEHFIPTHPKHYKYTISCSGGGGGDGEEGGGASCELNEERVDFEPDEGLYHTESAYAHMYIGNEYSMPTGDELRPTNIAVKFMIKAK